MSLVDLSLLETVCGEPLKQASHGSHLNYTEKFTLITANIATKYKEFENSSPWLSNWLNNVKPQ